ncbi:MAG TPA: aldo/keto reductase [Pseudonocardiaceae bacterium]|nr:aldo/keto reductase [Pseudonocardiaceae bacterium]
MRYRRLGNSGTVVSNLALGTMTFGAATPEEGAFAQLDAYLAAGGTLVDTADVYAGGESERIVGRWLAARDSDVTDRVVLATKGRFPTSGDPNGVGLSRRHLGRALDASLGRLGVDVIDLYQVHAWDPLTPIEETLGFLDDAVRAGKIRHFGLSNFTAWQLQKTVDTARFRGLPVPITLQPQYNLLTRELEWEIIPAALENGIGLLPWSPLSGGLLTGKYQRDGAVGENTRYGDGSYQPGQFMFGRRSSDQRTWEILEALAKIAAEREVNQAQVALAWVADRPSVSSVILGARTLEQLNDNLAAADLVLTAEEYADLDAASDPEPGDYPYGRFGTAQRSRPLTGGREEQS